MYTGTQAHQARIRGPGYDLITNIEIHQISSQHYLAFVGLCVYVSWGASSRPPPEIRRKTSQLHWNSIPKSRQCSSEAYAKSSRATPSNSIPRASPLRQQKRANTTPAANPQDLSYVATHTNQIPQRFPCGIYCTRVWKFDANLKANTKLPRILCTALVVFDMSGSEICFECTARCYRHKFSNVKGVPLVAILAQGIKQQ